MKDFNKLISVEIPCFNEVNNVRPMAETLIKIMNETGYRYQIFFIDNCSIDGTQNILRELAAEHSQIKVIMNMRNYGVMDGRSFDNAWKYNYNADVHISIPCDFQEPPELIPEFIKYWEEGFHIVAGQKIESEEGKIKYSLRQLFYNIIQFGTEVKQYKNMSGILLIDKYAAEAMSVRDKDIDIRFAIADTGFEVKMIPYGQKQRKSGKSSYNIWRYLSFAINSMVNTSVKPLRILTVCGFIMSFFSFCLAIFYLIMKLVLWDRFVAGIAPILIVVLFIGSVQMFFMGVLGEYIAVILRKITHYPNVVLSEKLNIDEECDKE